MSQTQVQKANAVRVGNGILKLGGTNIGLLRNAILNVEYNTLQIRAHNGYLPPKKKPASVVFTAELYEIDVDNLVLADGQGTKSTASASPVNVTGEALGTGRTVGSPIKINNKNGANTIVTSVVVDAGGSALTLNTDYRLYVGNGENGELGYTYIVPLTTQAGVLDVDYTYTPLASSTYTISDVLQLCDQMEVIFENVDSATGKVFRITIPAGYSNGNLNFAFQSDDTVDDVMTLPISFSALPDGTNRLVYIYDEQNP